MPMNANTPNTSTVLRAPRKFSTMTRLVQAAVLAVVLVPLGSVALEASTISSSTCSFYYFGGEDGCSGSTSSDTRTFSFDFGTFTLELFGLTQSTYITVTNATLTQSEFDLLNQTGTDADCITIAGTADGDCRMLWITASNPTAFTGWRQDTFWNVDTNTAYPNGDDPEGAEPGQVRVFRSEGDLDGNGELVGFFTEDMCLAAVGDSSYTPCEYFPAPTPLDPGIRSGDTDFSVITYAHVDPVPEPSTMLLLGTGAVGLVFRRRKRTKV